MHLKDTAAAELDHHSATSGDAHAGNVAALVLEPYGESYAWFKPQHPADDDRRYVVTQKGRDDLRRAEAREKLFGPWPRVADLPQDSDP